MAARDGSIEAPDGRDPPVEFALDLENLPQSIDLSPRRVDRLGPLLIGSCFVAFFIVLALAADVEGLGQWLFLSLFLVIGLLALGAGLRQVVRRRIACFDAAGVTVRERSLMGTRSWREAYAGFQGLLVKEASRHGEHDQAIMFDVVELRHAEAGKCLPVYSAPAAPATRRLWETYAARLGLPALEETAQGLVRRLPGELDTTLKERLRDGPAAWTSSHEAPVPKGLQIEAAADGKSIRIRITAPRVSLLPVLGVLAVFALAPLICLMAAGLTDWVPMVAAAEVLFLPLPLALLLADRFQPRELSLTRQRIAVQEPWLFGRRGITSLPLDAIETLHLEGPQGHAQCLVVAGDPGKLKTGHGLSSEALAWLRDYLTAAIAAA